MIQWFYMHISAGLGPGAVANAVGSQIINVFIGLGVPC